MGFKFYFSIFIFLGAPVCSWASCLPTEAVETINHEFQLEKWDTAQQNWARIEPQTVCQSDFEASVFKALMDLKNLPALDIQQDLLNFNFLKTSPYQFVKERVKTVRLAEGVGSCSSGVQAYVSARKSQTIYLCPLLMYRSSLEAQAVIVHETQHLDHPEDTSAKPELETVAHPHSRCTRGPYLKMDVCDDDFSNGGSYATHVEFLVKVARTKALPLSLRNEAKSSALALLLTRFNQLPYELKSGVLLQTQNGGVHFFTGLDQPMVTIVDSLSPEQLVGLRHLPTVFDLNSGTVKNYIYNEALADTPGSFSEVFRKLKPENQKKLVDVYFGNNQACFLFTNRLYCEVGPESRVLDLPPDLKPQRFNIIPLYGFDSVFIVDDKGVFYSLPFKLELKDWDANSFEINKTLQGINSVAFNAGSTKVAVELDGRLTSFDKLTERTPVAGYEHLVFKKVIAPFLWSDVFEAL